MSGFKHKVVSRSYKYKLIKKSLQNTLNLAEIDRAANSNGPHHSIGDTAENTLVANCSSSCSVLPSNKLLSSQVPPLVNQTGCFGNERCRSDGYFNLTQQSDEINETASFCNNIFKSDNSLDLTNQSGFEFDRDELDSDDSYDDEDSFTNSQVFLQDWAIKNNVTLTALSELLSWLTTNPDLSNIPRDARTLLKTPNNILLKNMGAGHFYYFGLTQKLTKVLTKNGNCNSLQLDFNVDGLPLHKSTNMSFWPILCRIQNLSDESPFAVAIFCGNRKPPLKEFMLEFIAELSHLAKNSLKVNERTVSIQIRAFCCDTPARAFIKGIKGHNGYYGCDKCCAEGQYINRRMVFADLHADSRTDVSFQMQENKEHHRCISPLLELPIGMVTSFPIDYMHCVCLGIMRKLLIEWRDGSRQFRLSKEQLVNIDKKIIEYRKYWPVEFNRQPRSLTEVERWKATEFRNFLLYSGPIALRDSLCKQSYCNFMVLRYAITILLVENLNLLHNHYALELLKFFVTNAAKIYGKEFLIYNSHALIHLPIDAKHFGSLNNISCFPFENYLGVLKNMLRKSNMPLQQVVRRLFERDDYSLRSKKNVGLFAQAKQVVIEITEEYSGDFYEKIILENFTLTNKLGNNCVRFKCGDIGEILYLVKQHGEIYILAKKVMIVEPFALYPTDSTFLSHLICKRSTETLFYSINEVSYKGVLLPYEEVFVFSPLLHLL